MKYLFIIQTPGLWIKSISWLMDQVGRVSACRFSTLRSKNKSYLCIGMSISRVNMLLYLKISYELADLVRYWDGCIFDVYNLVASAIYGYFRTFCSML
jgi:hypothetical protein